MATAADKLDTSHRSVSEKIIGFSPGALKAPFLLRCAAIFVDYIVLIGLPVGWLLVSRFFDDHGTPSVGTWVWLLGLILLILDFVLLPLLRGQTIGKMLVGITIVNIDGSDIRLAGIIKRNVIGYAVTALTFGLGFILAGLNPSGRALHDLIAGTTVVRARKTQL